MPPTIIPRRQYQKIAEPNGNPVVPAIGIANEANIVANREATVGAAVALEMKKVAEKIDELKVEVKQEMKNVMEKLDELMQEIKKITEGEGRGAHQLARSQHTEIVRSWI